MQWENIAPSIIKIAKATSTAAISELTSEIEEGTESPSSGKIKFKIFSPILKP